MACYGRWAGVGGGLAIAGERWPCHGRWGVLSGVGGFAALAGKAFEPACRGNSRWGQRAQPAGLTPRPTLT